jgi:hypothetical protein
MQDDQNWNRVRDRLGRKATDEQEAWFNENCPTFPVLIEIQRIIDSGLTLEQALALYLPSGCGFTVTEVP